MTRCRLSLMLAVVAIVLNYSTLTNAWDMSGVRQERIDAGVCLPSEEILANYDLCQKNESISNWTSSAAQQQLINVHCSCDANCPEYDNCCVDISKPGQSPQEAGPKFSCIQLPPFQYTATHVFAITSCSTSWTEANVRMLCQKESRAPKAQFMQSIPVYSESTNYLYDNYFCALCNYDAVHLMKANLSLYCTAKGKFVQISSLPANAVYDSSSDSFLWTDYERRAIRCVTHVDQLLKWTPLDGSLRLKTCFPAIDTCPLTFNLSNEIERTISEKCAKYTSYVFRTEQEEDEWNFEDDSEPNEETQTNDRDLITYRNYHCALCNGIEPSELVCVAPGHSHSPPSVGSASLALLFDFNFVALGELAAADSVPCSPGDGLIFDPIERNCVQLFCGRMFELDAESGRCLRTLKVPGNGTRDFLDSHCLKLLIERRDFVEFENGTVLVDKYEALLTPGQFEVFSATNTSISSILVCIDKEKFHIPFSFPTSERLLTLFTLFLSTICLVAHLMTFVAIPTLRNAPGKILMSLSSALLLANGSFLVGTYNALATDVLRNARGSLTCVISGILIHYSYLASFCWMNVMAFDVFRTFSRSVRMSASDRQYSFLRYSLYSWLSPALLVMTCCALDIGLEDSLYRPLYGHRVCWLSQRRAIVVYFAVPVAILLLINVTLFTLTAISVIRTGKQAQMARRESEKCRFLIYAKLATVMGLAWTFGFLAAVAGYSVLVVPFIVLNGLQGTIIFVAFTCKRKVWRLGCERWTSLMGSPSMVPANISQSSSERAAQALISSKTQSTLM